MRKTHFKQRFIYAARAGGLNYLGCDILEYVYHRICEAAVVGHCFTVPF
jgi:hypothetical protein